MKYVYFVGGINPLWDIPVLDTWSVLFTKQEDILERRKMKGNGFTKTYIKRRENKMGYFDNQGELK